jgi:hypothetical protein
VTDACRARGTATAEHFQKLWDVEKFSLQAVVRKLGQTNIEIFFCKLPSALEKRAVFILL